MEMSDDMLVTLARIDPMNVPTTFIGRCLRLLDEAGRARLVRSVTKRRPRNERERRILLHYAVSEGVGGVLFVDMLGGFDGQRPC